MRLSPWSIARSPLEVQDLFFRQRAVDPPGYRVHLACAVLACFLAGWPTGVAEWAALPVLICFFIRMTTHHRMLRTLWLDPCGWLTLLFAAWVGLSFFWSAARDHPETSRQWINDVQSLRFAGFAAALWPVLDRRGLLIRALVLGIFCGQLAQFGQWGQEMLGVNWFAMHRMPGRTSGWWDPVVGGSILCVGLGLHLSAALLGVRPRVRLIGLAGVVITIACIIATGTRGAWIGAATLVVISLLIAAWRITPRSRLVKPALAIMLIGILGVGTIWFAAGSSVRDRFHRGVDEVHAALTQERYDTDTGLRIAMWKWAIAAWKTHPIRGVGAGGYQPWVHEQTPASAAELGAPAAAIPLVHKHAHSWYLHTLATAGIIGGLILGALTILAIWSGLRGPRNFSPATGYAAGPALAIIGLACAGLFDPITTNSQTAYLFWLLTALCLPMRPPALDEGSLS